MKAAIVSLSTVQKYSRWDAGFYIGMLENQTMEERVARAENRVETAKATLKKAKANLKESKKRIDKMVANGEILPL